MSDALPLRHHATREGILAPTSTWFFVISWVHTANHISIGSAVFVALLDMTHTDCAISLGMGRINALHACYVAYQQQVVFSTGSQRPHSCHPFVNN